MQKPLIELTKVAHRYAAEKQAILYEILNGIETVKANCAENIMQARWEQVVNLSAKVGVRLRFLVNSSMFFSIFLQQFATVAVVIVGVYLISQNELTTGALIACTLLSSRALAPMAQIAALLTRYHQTSASLDSLNNIMTLPIERHAGIATIHVKNLKGDIEFNDVSFQYVSRALPIIENVSFKITAGERVGIIGRVGAGKSTIAKLLMKLLQPSRGSIFFDGIDQSHLDVGELRRNIGYVPQDVTLFYGTLRENITFGAPQVNDAELLRAIEISGIDELIKPYLGSYESPISEGGRNLSGGQRRIIAIARALLLDPPIFVLDEPTHAMDSQTENFIKDRLFDYLKYKTLILMTHHAPLLTLVDRIIIIDDGKVIMDGPKQTVLQALAEGKIAIPKK
jgi:ATP-binding cassette subfamily C protein LapB